MYRRYLVIPVILDDIHGRYFLELRLSVLTPCR